MQEFLPTTTRYCYIIVLQVVEVHGSIDHEGSGDDSQSGSLSGSREKLLPHVSLKHCCLFVGCCLCCCFDFLSPLYIHQQRRARPKESGLLLSHSARPAPPAKLDPEEDFVSHIIILQYIQKLSVCEPAWLTKVIIINLLLLRGLVPMLWPSHAH